MAARDRRFAALGVGAVVLASALMGALFMNLYVGEVGGFGPGSLAKLDSSVKVDTVTVITTSDPGRFVATSSGVVRWVTLGVWQLTGKMWAEPDGRWSIYWSRHAGVLTTDGKDWLEDQISDSPSTTPAAYISVSSSAHAPAAGDHKLWNEIDTGGGLDRAGGTYTSTGAGAWTVVKQFTADATYTNVQCTGLNWSDTDSANGTMLCADTFTAATLASSDTITVTWTLSVS